MPLPGFEVVDAVDALQNWELERERNRLVDDPVTFHYKYDIYRVLGKGGVKEVNDPQKRKCLEISIESDPMLHKLMAEYAGVRLKRPIPIQGEVTSVGLWVKGNSGWGQVFWELEDADGKRLVSSGLGPYGNAMDYQRQNIHKLRWLGLPFYARNEKISDPGSLDGRHQQHLERGAFTETARKAHGHHLLCPDASTLYHGLQSVQAEESRQRRLRD